MARDPHGARSRQQERRDDLEQRRLAGAVQSEKTDDLAGVDLEADACEGLNSIAAAAEGPQNGRALSIGSGGAGARLQPEIEALWLARNSVTPDDGEAREIVRRAVDLLDSGRERVAEVDADGGVVVHEWLVRAVTLV